jgi:hypothetical protein
LIPRGSELDETSVATGDRPATWNGTTSHASPAVGVRPFVIFRTLNARLNRYFVRVQAARSYGRNIVRIQRQNNRGVWVTTLRVQLNAGGRSASPASSRSA